jgi:2-amino-4-hydroxy-6-hydroxymethyldihydropteridine diphosphokinase
MHFNQLRCSVVYKCKPVGFDGKSFLNWVVSAQTELSVAEVVKTLKQIEAQYGRVRGEAKYGSRTLDLDLLTFDQTVTETPVELPRGEILHHAFVLKPLCDLVPNEVHPVCHKTYQELWQAFDHSSQQIKPIEFAWSATA